MDCRWSPPVSPASTTTVETSRRIGLMIGDVWVSARLGIYPGSSVNGFPEIVAVLRRARLRCARDQAEYGLATNLGCGDDSRSASPPEWGAGERARRRRPG